MKPARILRLAAVFAAVQYIAHAILFLSATPKHGAEEVAVIDAMKAHRFEFSGFSRSYWNFYFGYGLLGILWGVVEVVLLWQLAKLAEADPRQVRPTIGLLVAANAAHALLTGTYFFPAPVIFDVLVAATLVWSYFASRTHNASGAIVGGAGR